MKRRVLSMLCSLLILCGMVLSITVDVSAGESEGAGVMVDGSLLTQDDYSEGLSSNAMMRGKHLMDGQCAISKAGNGRIYVYGQTTADHVVDFIAVLMDVERYNEETDGWGFVAAYTEDARDKYYIIADDTLKVERGYYYRVHCEHFAGNDDEEFYDEAFSVTNGIMIP